jgi:eukaryotic-like serine/threonine-protein kinase
VRNSSQTSSSEPGEGSGDRDGRDDQGAATILTRTPSRRFLRRRRPEATLRSGTDVQSPGAALQREEIERTAEWARMMIALSAVGMLLAPLLGGDPLGKKLLLVAIAVLLGSNIWLYWMTRDPSRYRPFPVGLSSLIQGWAGAGAIYYFGVFSAFPAIVALGIYFYALGENLRYSLASYVNLAASQGILGGLVIGGVIADAGLVRAGDLPVTEQVFMQGAVQIVFLLSFLLGRISRAKTVSAVTDLERAVRSVAQREAIINEARQELERAAWIGGPGRFSEQTLGAFRLGVVIGRGAMGEVYEAVHLETGEIAAVKLLQRNNLGDPKEVQRFTREARIAASLNVPNVVRVLDVSGPDAPLPYLAMERLEGRDLGHYLREEGKLSFDRTDELVCQVALGLDAAREAGIVHRDLKPQNLFYAEQGERSPLWKILDFGVSTLAGEGGTLTQGLVIGTPGYMAPEQAQGKRVDHRADVYSLAVIAYRCLTGQPAFPGKDAARVLYDVVHRQPPRPRDLNPQIPAALEAVLARGLAKRPEDRHQTASDLAASFTRAANRRA